MGLWSVGVWTLVFGVGSVWGHGLQGGLCRVEDPREGIWTFGVPVAKCGSEGGIMVHFLSANVFSFSFLQGILSAFLLALLTGRAFYIHHPRPSWLSEFLVPSAFVDWRNSSISPKVRVVKVMDRPPNAQSNILVNLPESFVLVCCSLICLFVYAWILVHVGMLVGVQSLPQMIASLFGYKLRGSGCGRPSVGPSTPDMYCRAFFLPKQAAKCPGAHNCKARCAGYSLVGKIPPPPGGGCRDGWVGWPQISAFWATRHPPPPGGVRVRFLGDLGLCRALRPVCIFHTFFTFFSYCVKHLNPSLHKNVRNG